MVSFNCRRARTCSVLATVWPHKYQIISAVCNRKPLISKNLGEYHILHPPFGLQCCDILSYVASILNRLNILKNLSLVQESCISYENRQLQRVF